MDPNTLKELKREINEIIMESYKFAEENELDYYLGKAAGLQVALDLIVRRERNE